MQLEDIDLHEEILITMQSVSECSICESEYDLFENEGLEDSTQLFGLEPATNLPALLLMKQR